MVESTIINEDVLKPLPEKDGGQAEVSANQPQNDDLKKKPKSSKRKPRRKRWHCEKCNKSYTSSGTFKSHKYRHKMLESGRFTCQQCEKRFVNISTLGSHKCPKNPVPAAEKTWVCKECNKTFTNGSAFYKHAYDHRVVKAGKFKCKTCEKCFRGKSALAKHVKNVHQKEKKTRAKKLTKKTSKPEAEKNPVSADGRSWVCKECDKVFGNPYRFYQHTYYHRNVKAGKFKCEPCDKNKKASKRKKLIKESSSESESEQVPKVVEKDDKGFLMCPDCDKRFEFRFQYTIHARHHVALKQELYKCTPCELLFKTNAELKRHEKVHEKQKSRISSDPYGLICPEPTLKELDGIYKCSACEKTFEQRHLGLRHLLRHGFIKRERIQCNLCPLTFANKKYLEKHQVEHEAQKDVTSSESSSEEESGSDDSSIDGDSEFKCTVCNKTFWEKRLLDRHIRRHEAIKESKFPCKLCDVRCGDKRELIRHEEMHARKQQTTIVSTEKVPPIILERNNHTVYKCPDCAIIFTKQRVYFTHAQGHVHVRIGTFKCESCGTCCPTRRSLLAHIEKHRTGKVKTQTELDSLSFECPECGKKFARRQFLSQHVQRHDAVEKGTFQCKVCAKFYGSRSRTSRGHEAKRSGAFECSVCGKKMGSKSELVVHKE
ncbi:hypothetical protein quinque_011392 [Culex quinquefasciatus]